MKGGIACAVAAVLDHLAAHDGKPKGSISFLITGDEEGIAVNGTPKLLKWAAERGEKFDHCILGEPSNQEVLGRHDQDRPPRITQWPSDCDRQAGPRCLSATCGQSDPRTGDADRRAASRAHSMQGSAQFSPSHLEFTSVDVGNKTVNLIPGEARARFNIRFNDKHTLDSLKKLIEQRAAKAAGRKDKIFIPVGAIERRRIRDQVRTIHRTGHERRR